MGPDDVDSFSARLRLGLPIAIRLCERSAATFASSRRRPRITLLY